MGNANLKFLGHATIYLEWEDLKIIFDPNFSSKIPFLKRKQAPFFDTNLLHSVNAIFYSSGHFHRLDVPSLRYFKQTAQVVLPMGLEGIINPYFQFHISTLKAPAKLNFGSCEITALPCLHNGSRWPSLSYNNTLNYLLKSNDMSFLYIGDSRYDGAYFHEISKEHRIDAVVLPIDHVGPDTSANGRYMTSTQALQAFEDLDAKIMIPNCFGAFHWSSRNNEKFLDDFRKEIDLHGLANKVHLLLPGQGLELSSLIEANPVTLHAVTS